ncbi:MAG: hypothetical protein ACUVXA_09345 [Candidatus Jordarchaeum sp.]|uniref:hypothetical protein n=1 Tax=Candidatus Jordarchaeum sp. TaxID=2823881 RepID=UPI00404AAD4A
MVGARRFFTVNQVDATGVGSPHQKELEEFSSAKFLLFKGLEEATLRRIVYEDLGAELDNVGLSEDWTITIEFFPEANVHISYFYYGDEFGDVEGELKFLLSGERVYWIPGEDSVTYTDIVLDFIERRIKNEEPSDKEYDEKTGIMKKVLEQRKEPFNFLEEEDVNELGKFIGGEVSKRGSNWSIKKEVLPEIFIEIIFDKGKNMLDISYSGKNLTKIGSYHIELIGVFTINHILRYITIKNQDKELPDICYKMFSRLFTKEKGWDHRKTS